MGFLGAMLSKTWTRVVLYVALVGGIAAGVGTVLWTRSEVERAQSFAEVEGVVTRSEIQRQSKGRPLPVIQARYEYEGHRGRATLIAARGVEGEGKLQPEELVARYPVGTPIAVFVNPDDPSEGVLSRSYDGTSTLGGSLLLTVLLGYVIVLDVRRRRQITTPAIALDDDST
jgi:hypothetical protein